MITKFMECNKYSFRLFKNLLFDIMKHADRFKKLSDRKKIIFNITHVVAYFSLLLNSDYPVILRLFLFVDRKLSPNITMIILHFYIGVENCKLDNLTVSNLKENRKEYLYCGHHPVFNFYPEFSHLMIKFFILYKMPFELKAIFSVTDTNTIVSKFLSPFQKKVKFASVSQLFASKLGILYVSSFLIKVNVLFQIVVLTNSQKLVVYDGPGYTNDVLENGLENAGTGFIAYVASTFQCTLVVLGDYAIPGVERYASFRRKEHSRQISTQIKEDSNIHLYLRIRLCKTNICAIRFETGKNLHINLTINKIISKYLFHSDCLYGGFATVTEKSGNFFPTTLCGNSSHLKEPVRSFYSIINLLSVVLYRYTGTSMLNVIISVSATKCMAARLDPCTIQSICGAFLTHKCSSYLQTQFRYKIWSMKFETIHSELHVSISDDNCVILQLGNWHLEDLHQELAHFGRKSRFVISWTLRAPCNIPLIFERGKIINLKGSLNIFWKTARVKKNSCILATGAIDCVKHPSYCPYSLNKKTISRIAFILRRKGISSFILKSLQNIKSLWINMFWSRLKYDWIEKHLTAQPNKNNSVEHGITLELLMTRNLMPYFTSITLKPTGKLGINFLLKIYGHRVKNILLHGTVFQLKIDTYIHLDYPKMRLKIRIGK